MSPRKRRALTKKRIVRNQAYGKRSRGPATTMEESSFRQIWRITHLLLKIESGPSGEGCGGVRANLRCL